MRVKIRAQDIQLVKLKDQALRKVKSLNDKLKADAQASAIAMVEMEIKLAEGNKLLEEKSNVDFSTEVMNRNYFDTRFESEWQRAYRNQRHLSLLIIDIDDFTAINEKFGIATGDELLQMVASILVQSIGRISDIVTRFSGDQFAVILPETEFDGAGAVAEKLRLRVESAVMTNEEHTLSLTVSIGGLSAMPATAQGWQDALLSIKDALVDAKHAGKNKVKFAGVKGLYNA